MINARAETLLEKPSFKRLVVARRCLVGFSRRAQNRVGDRVEIQPCSLPIPPRPDQRIRTSLEV
jgi:hypothetical protein